MASPVDAGRNTTTIATAADPWTVNLPASVQSGDLLIVYGRTGGNTTHNLPNGWSWLVQNDTSDASDDRSSVIYRWADGTEGTTLSWDLSGTAKGACISWRITGAANVGVQAPETPAPANSTTAANSADPPTVTPTGGSKDYLFIVLGGLDGEGQTWAHSVYVNDQTVNSGTVGSAATNCVVGGATRQATASSENPAAWTHGSASTGTSAWTIAVHPAVAITKTGAGIRGDFGSGERYRDPITSEKTGKATMGIAAAETAKITTGVGIRGFSGVAADVITWIEAGGAIGSRVAASAVDLAIHQETGAGIRNFVGSGARVSSGGGTTYSKQNSGIAGFSGTAGDNILWPEDGKGILSRVGSGPKIVSSLGITYSKAGIAVMGVTHLPAVTKAGTGITGFVGSGASQKVGAGKSGFGISGRSAGGVRAMVYVEADAGGADAPEPPALEADHPANIVFKASGVSIKVGGTTYAKQNSSIIGFAAGGKDQLSTIELGTSIRGHSAAGTDQTIHVETGPGIRGSVGSGGSATAGGATYVKQNAGIAVFSAGGKDTLIHVQQEGGIAAFSGTAADEIGWNESGAGIRGSVASGAKTVGGFTIYTKQNTAVLSGVGFGTDDQTFLKKGAGILSFVGSGSKQAQLGTTYSKSGSAILSATVGSVRARTISRSSAGILDRSGRGVDVVSWGETGKGIATFTAGGLRSYGRIPGGVTIVTQIEVELTVEGGLAAEVEVEDGSGALVTVG